MVAQLAARPGIKTSAEAVRSLGKARDWQEDSADLPGSVLVPGGAPAQLRRRQVPLAALPPRLARCRDVSTVPACWLREAHFCTPALYSSQRGSSCGPELERYTPVPLMAARYSCTGAVQQSVGREGAARQVVMIGGVLIQPIKCASSRAGCNAFLPRTQERLCSKWHTKRIHQAALGRTPAPGPGTFAGS